MNFSAVARRLVRFSLYGLIGLLAVAATLFALALYLSRDRDSAFYVLNAELEDIGYLDRLHLALQGGDPFREDVGFGFSAHRLKAGQGTVLSYRHFSDGSFAAIDDEHYEKLTIWLRSPASISARQSLRIPEQGVVLLSSGGSAWPRHDCSGHIKGVVELAPLGSGVSVRIQGGFEPRGIRDLGRTCKPREFTLQFQAGPVRLQDLNSWQGGAGAAHPYEETYAR